SEEAGYSISNMDAQGANGARNAQAALEEGRCDEKTRNCKEFGIGRSNETDHTASVRAIRAEFAGEAHRAQNRANRALGKSAGAR
ncbi:MAG: hypothetical protein ACRD4Y_01985, partial [Candidatus Acidiferrales bacterium]